MTSSSSSRDRGTPEQMADYAGQLVGAAFASGQFMFADTDLKIDLPQVLVTVHRERRWTSASTSPMWAASSAS